MFCSNDNVYQNSISLFSVSSLVFKRFQQKRYFADVSFYKTHLFKITLDGIMASVCGRVHVCALLISKEQRIEQEMSEMIRPLVLNKYMHLIPLLTLLNTFSKY